MSIQLQKRFRSLGALAAFVFSLFLEPSLLADEKTQLRVGFHLDRNHYEKDYSDKDVTLATEILFTRVLSSKGGFKPSFRVFRKQEQYIEAVEAGELDYLELSPLFWLRLPTETREQIKPVSIIQMGEKRLTKYLLLAPPGSTVESLRGKRIKAEVAADRGIVELWLSHLLQQEGEADATKFFGKIEHHRTAEKILLPTFFGKADACIIKADDYEIAVELNPQIAQRLAPIKTSPGFPLVMTATAGPQSAEIRARLGGTADVVMREVGAKQAMDLLRIKGILSFEESDLDGLREILGEMEKVESAARSTKPGEK